MTRPTRNGIKVRAAGLLIRRGRLLLLEHRKGKDRYWVLPGGGVETGETAAGTVEREIREELGIGVRTGRFAFCDEVVSGTRHNIDLYFFCALAGRPKFRLEKGTAVSSYGFFTAAELKRLRIRPPMNAILARLAAGAAPRNIFSSYRRGRG